MAKSFKNKAAAESVLGTFMPQEEQQAQDTLHTQGRKGMKAARINMAFTPENYDYIRVMRSMRGENMTDFVNYVIAEHRREHGEKYEQAKEIMKDM